MQCLWKDMDSLLFAQIDRGKKEFFITGHSQGGALAYLLTAHLLIMQENGIIPSDVRFKTYCSAAPKPGNLYFAYYYEKMTQQGWAYNTVNALDWVPESPFSIQTVNDFNAINPFRDAKKAMKKLLFIVVFLCSFWASDVGCICFDSFAWSGPGLVFSGCRLVVDVQPQRIQGLADSAV